MLDSFKAASVAAFMVGAAATSGALAADAVVTTTNAVVVQQVPSTTVVTPLPGGDVQIAPQSARPAIDAPDADAPATNLPALVRQFGSSAADDSESECLAGAVYFESKGEPLEGQLAVANVILNRASSGRFPASACGVVHQPGQFSFVRGSGFPPIPRGSLAWKQAVAIAHIAEEQLWKPVAAKALFFHAKRVSPNWRLARVAAVGNHIFYR